MAALPRLRTSAFVVLKKAVRGTKGRAEVAEAMAFSSATGSRSTDFDWPAVSSTCNCSLGAGAFGTTCCRCEIKAAASLMPACLTDQNT